MTEPTPPSPDSKPAATGTAPMKTVHVRPTGKLKRYVATLLRRPQEREQRLAGTLYVFELPEPEWRRLERNK
jgi:hypothetical protein